VTDLFEQALAGAGWRIERAAARDGTRGIAVANRDSGGTRALVTVVGLGVESTALAAHDGWDLPIDGSTIIETASGPRLLVAELLPDGVPSTWVTPVEPPTTRPVPAFGLELARRILTEHLRGAAVGRLHPATVLVEPADHALVAVAQRPLRIATSVAVEGDRPLLGYSTWTPGDAGREPPSMADDVFRLAILLWRWRHASHPFGTLPDGELLELLGQVATGSAPPLPLPADDLDRMLIACLVPAPAARPTVADIVMAVEAAGPPT